MRLDDFYFDMIWPPQADRALNVKIEPVLTV